MTNDQSCHNKNPVTAICLGLVILTCAAFLQVITFDFIVLDDGVYVYANPYVQQGISMTSLKWAVSAGFLEKTMYIDYWQPVTILSRLIDFELFGANPAGHHFMNLFFHCGNVLLLFLFLRSLTSDPWRSAFVAAVFAVHPLQAEPVAWVTGRKDLLATCFLFSTLIVYHHWSLVSSTRRYLLLIVLFALGLMAKPLLLPLPFLLILLDAVVFKKWKSPRSIAGLLVEKTPFILLSAASFAITLVSRSSSLFDSSAPDRLQNAMVLYLVYLKKILFPHGLLFRYSRLSFPLSIEEVVLAGVLLVPITWVVVRVRAKYSALPLGWGWFLIMLLPVITATDAATADRFTYVPVVGIAMMFAWGAPPLLERVFRARFFVWASALTVITGSAYLCHVQASVWRDSDSLFGKAVSQKRDVFPYSLHYAKYLARNGRDVEALGILQTELNRHPENWRVYEALGVAMIEGKRYARAEEYLRRGLEIDPGVALFYSHLGRIYREQEEFELSARLYEKALSNYPEFVNFRIDYARALSRISRLDEAEEEFRRALAIAPRNPTGNNGLGVVLSRQGRLEEALVYFLKAAEFRETRLHAHLNLGWNLWELGRFVDAERHYRSALAIDSTSAKALTEIAPVLVKQKKIADAIQMLERAVAIDANDKISHLNLGLLYKATGRGDEAAREFRRSLEIDPNFEKAKRESEALQN